jgi:nucleoside-diphosphate-sugar epimerase
MKLLITGNLGYVGPGVVKEFRKHYPDSEIIGYDVGYFSKYITNTGPAPENYLNAQFYGDVRNFPENLLKGVDTVIALAAISNDPIGNKFEKPTLDINYRAAVEIAVKAKRQGVKKFIYASSCSVYGAAEDMARTETSDVNPLTAYAKSKIYAENELATLADQNFQITCHRFATACGMSERLRLDLVLNDFVAGAITSGEIGILSDGTPWRPLINVLDMARAMRWSHERKNENGGVFLVVNTGSNQWNFMVKELAEKVQLFLPKTKISINTHATPDKRSYRVDFSLFEKLAPNHQPVYSLEDSVKGLIDGYMAIGFTDKNFRNSNLMRLNIINDLLKNGFINSDLRFVV